MGPDGECENFRSPGETARTQSGWGLKVTLLVFLVALTSERTNQKILVLTGASTVGAGHQLLSLARLPVGVLVAQAEVTVVVGDDGAVGGLLSCRQEEIHVRKRAFSHLFLICDCQGLTFVVV